jgi:hypothetical protein
MLSVQSEHGAPEVGMTIFLGTRSSYLNMNCHPDRSVAKWRDLRLNLRVFKP